MASTPKIAISVIIPMHNSSWVIDKCLSSIFNSDYKKFEVIVVDDASTDNSREIASRFQCRIVHNQSVMGPSYSRNLGVEYAKGSIVLFIDSDIIVEKNSIGKVAEIMQKREDISGVSGVYSSNNPYNNFLSQYKTLAINYRDLMTEDINTDSFRASFLALRKSIFKDLRFNGSYRDASIEDLEFGRLLIARGKKFYQDKSIRVHHFKKFTLSKFISNQINRSQALTSSFLLQKSYNFYLSGRRKNWYAKLYLLRVPMAYAMILSLFLALLSPLFAYLSLSLLFLSILLEFNFLKYSFQKKGLLFVIGAIPFYFIDGFVSGLGVVKAMKWDKRPFYLIYFVTSKCNLKCRHCFYWRSLNSGVNELSLDEIDKIARSLDISFLRITGGEPFLRKDLYQVVKLFYVRAGLRRISINTNGTLTDEIFSTVSRIVRDMPKLQLELGISINGLEEQHNKICGADSFENAMQTFEKLKALRFKNFRCGFVVTMNAENQDNLIEVIDFLASKRPDGIALNVIRGKPKDNNLMAVNPQLYMRYCAHINKYFRKDDLFQKLRAIKTQIAQKLVFNLLTKKKRIYNCMAARNIAVLYADGNLHACEVFDSLIGNVRDFGYNLRLMDLNRNNIASYISKKKCFCTHECFMTASFFNAGNLIRMLKSYLE